VLVVRPIHVSTLTVATILSETLGICYGGFFVVFSLKGRSTIKFSLSIMYIVLIKPLTTPRGQSLPGLPLPSESQPSLPLPSPLLLQQS
jgi:hypothetical protein